MLPITIIRLARSSPAGLFCRKQVFRLGFNDINLHRWRREGLIERLAPGWYRLSEDPVPSDQCLHLPLEYMREKGGEKAVLTGLAALAARGVGDVELPLTPTVLIPNHYQVRVKEAPWIPKATDLTTVPSEIIRGFRLAGLARCLADAVIEEPNGSVLDDADVLSLFDAVVNAERLSVPALAVSWQEMRRHDGAARLLSFYERGDLDTESGGERDVLSKIFRRNPPVPDCQVWVTPRRRVDFVFIAGALIVEYYGVASHRDRVDADAMRIHELRRLGWEVYVLTKSILRHDPEGAAEMIHQLRRRREALIASGELARPALPVQPARRVPLRTLLPAG